MPNNVSMSESESEADTLERLETALASIAAHRGAAHSRLDSTRIAATLDQAIARLRHTLAEIEPDGGQ